MAENRKEIFKISFPGVSILFVILLILKFTLIPQMSWWWVFSPIWLPIALFLVLIILWLIFALILAFIDTYH